ncbi:MAG TPA: metal-dependent hydrolase [Thermoanaerobaculia bacterium]|nr:metal-dependent hydrolase [Thermoanaerobaculia bacterium]
MFVGHFAVGLAAKRSAPALSLGTFFLAAQLVDLIWPLLVLAGVEHVRIAPGITRVTPLDFTHYPWTHSLLAAVFWGALLAGILVLAKRPRRAALLAGAVVVSHWLLDWLSHRPDLPLAPGGEGRYGLELWASLPGTLAVELGLFAAGVVLYSRGTKPLDGQGRWGWWGLVAFLLAVYLANLFGPPPPSETAIGWAGLSMWLLVAWGYWVDRHRRPAEAAALLSTPP